MVDVLLMQGELQERMRYLKEGNLFAYDTTADTDAHDRDTFLNKVMVGMDV